MLNIFQDSKFHIRFFRILWFFVVVIGLTLFVYQVTDRIIVYYQRNTNVDVAVKYVPSVEFPSVTICNQNQFRLESHIFKISSTWRRYLWDIETKLFIVTFCYICRITSTVNWKLYNFINDYFSQTHASGSAITHKFDSKKNFSSLIKYTALQIEL